MSEEQQPESNSPAPAKGTPLRRRRGYRGGHGRGRNPCPPVKNDLAKPAPTVESSVQGESPATPVESSAKAPEPLARPRPPRSRFEPAVHTPRAPRTDGSAISQAVNEVMQVVESLKQTLEQMEEVLELVELAERQKLTDEREIKSLLRALRQFQSRGGGAERHDRPEHHNRSNRPQRPERQGGPEHTEQPEPQPMD